MLIHAALVRPSVAAAIGGTHGGCAVQVKPQHERPCGSQLLGYCLVTQLSRECLHRSEQRPPDAHAAPDLLGSPAKSLVSKLAAMTEEERGYVLRHGTEVAQLMLALGMEPCQLARLVCACPELFAWPAAAQGRLPTRFEELLQLPGMTASDVARCFVEFPAAARAGPGTFAAAIEALTRDSRQPDELVMFLHQLATLLRDRPSAVELLCQPAGHLAQRLADFEQRYSPYWDDRGTGDYEGPRRLNTPDKILAGALRANRHLLVTDWSHFLAVEALLQAELGHQPGDGTRLVVYHAGRLTG